MCKMNVNKMNMSLWSGRTLVSGMLCAAGAVVPEALTQI